MNSNEHTFYAVFCINWDDHVVFLSFILLMWCITLIDLHVLNHPCILQINPSWPWCIILLIWCSVHFSSWIIAYLWRFQLILDLPTSNHLSFLTASPTDFRTGTKRQGQWIYIDCLTKSHYHVRFNPYNKVLLVVLLLQSNLSIEFI